MKEVSLETWFAPIALRSEEGSSTCGDNAKGEATSLVKILTGDCQGGCIDQTTTQAYGKRKKKTQMSRKTWKINKNGDAMAHEYDCLMSREQLHFNHNF